MLADASLTVSVSGPLAAVRAALATEGRLAGAPMGACVPDFLRIAM